MEHNDEMTTTIQEEAVVVAQNLMTLRVEHTDLLDELSVASDKGSLITKHMELIELGLDDARLMLSLTSYLEMIHTEEQNLCAEVCRLSQENEKLRCELADTQQKLLASEQAVIQLEEDKRIKEDKWLLELVESTRQYDPITPVVEGDPATDLLPAEKNETLIYEWRKAWSPFARAPFIAWSGSDFMLALGNLAIQYGSQGRYEVAVPLCKQAIMELETAHGHDHPDVAEMLTILAFVYRDQNKNKEAVKLLNDALAIREHICDENHPSVAATLNDIANLYSKMGKYKEAEPLFKRAMNISVRLHGPDYSRVAEQSNNLATVCVKQGKYREAKQYCQRLLEVYGVNHDPDDRNIVKAKKIIVKCCRRQKKCKDAEKEKLTLDN